MTGNGSEMWTGNMSMTRNGSMRCGLGIRL